MRSFPVCRNVSLAPTGCDDEWMRNRSTCLKKKELPIPNNGIKQLQHGIQGLKFVILPNYHSF